MSQKPALVIFLIIVVGGGLVIGYLTAPGDWYAALTKPSFNPPNWIFGPVWTLLYVLIAISGWRTWARNRSSWAMKLWWLQIILNFLWSPTFFAAQRIDLALIVIALLMLSILGFIAASWKNDRTASWLFTPYALWVAFATLLNASILVLN